MGPIRNAIRQFIANRPERVARRRARRDMLFGDTGSRISTSIDPLEESRQRDIEQGTSIGDDTAPTTRSRRRERFNSLFGNRQSMNEVPPVEAGPALPRVSMPAQQAAAEPQPPVAATTVAQGSGQQAAAAPATAVMQQLNAVGIPVENTEDILRQAAALQQKADGYERQMLRSTDMRNRVVLDKLRADALASSQQLMGLHYDLQGRAADRAAATSLTQNDAIKAQAAQTTAQAALLEAQAKDPNQIMKVLQGFRDLDPSMAGMAGSAMMAQSMGDAVASPAVQQQLSQAAPVFEQFARARLRDDVLRLAPAAMLPETPETDKALFEQRVRNTYGYRADAPAALEEMQRDLIPAFIPQMQQRAAAKLAPQIRGMRPQDFHNAVREETLRMSKEAVNAFFYRMYPNYDATKSQRPAAGPAAMSPAIRSVGDRAE